VNEPEDEKVLALRYGQVTEERDRLRDARRFFARQLGPLPTVAGLSLGAVGVFSDFRHNAWLYVALGAFVAMTAVSIAFSGRPPYRVLRARHERGAPATTIKGWYERELSIEDAVYEDMEVEMGRERLGVFATQLLFLIVVACLLLGHLDS
jgi:hypothetical protein